MSGEENDGAERSHEPTQKRLDDARKRGDIPLSVDLTTAAAYAGFLLAAAAFGGAAMLSFAGVLQGLLANAVALADDVFAASGAPLSATILGHTSLSMLPWFALPAALALACILAQGGPAISGEKLQPKLSRISPLATMGQKFGAVGMFEFAKSLAKLLIYCIVLGLYLVFELPNMISAVQLDPANATLEMLRLTVGLMWIVLVIALAIGLLDLLFQRLNHLKRNRMTYQEVIDEMKESEGDAQLKGQRRQRGIAMAMNQMIAEVPKASVVIVNPTHYAVALAWDPSRDGAPRCVAKGVDEVALRIRAVAAEHGIPIQSDPPTARALFAEVELGAEVTRNHYRAVAAAIRFAERIRGKAAAR